MILDKIEDIKKQLSSIKVDDAKKVLLEKKELIANKCDDIITDAEEIAIPAVINATKKVKTKSDKFLGEVIEDLEARSEEVVEKKAPKTTKKTATKKASK